MDSIPMSPTDHPSGIRAVICDVYGTLLNVGPPPVNGGQLWESGCRALAGGWMPLDEYNARCASLIETLNDERRVAGEPFPDVDWLALTRRLNPGQAECRVRQLSDLHAQCVRTCTAMPGAISALEKLHARGVLLGIASNAQDYTRGELQRAGIPLHLFDPALCFLSGEHGFAKPSPRVFSFLNEQLAALGIAPRETLMIGDSAVNDIAPAAAAGWLTWQIGPRSWEELIQQIL